MGNNPLVVGCDSGAWMGSYGSACDIMKCPPKSDQYKYYPGIYTPIKCLSREKGQLACASNDGRNCFWGNSLTYGTYNGTNNELDETKAITVNKLRDGGQSISI